MEYIGKLMKRQTIFERVSGSKTLPTVIKVIWDPSVAEKMKATIQHGSYIDRMPLHEKKPAVTPIDLSENGSLLEEIRYDLRCWKPQPAAIFLLKWEQSEGILISTLSDIRNISAIIHLFCQHVIHEMRQTDPECVLISKFENVEHFFLTCLNSCLV